MEFLVNGVIPVIQLDSIAGDPKQGNLILIYGGTKVENFRFRVADSLGEKLASLDFNVYCFDFRSNLDASRFYEFGLYDRLEDAREVVRWVLESKKEPISLMGVSMGGPLAATIASELGDKIRNLFLVAPAAYTHKAMKPEVKFGQQFKEIIRESWSETNSFGESKRVCANTLIVQFREDEIVPKQIPMNYWKNVGEEAKMDQNILLTIHEGGHNGCFSSPQRQEEIVREMRNFLALPSRARD